MSNDLTLDDLASGATNATESAAEETAKEAVSNESTGEWITGLYDRLRDDGLIMPLLFGPEAAPAQPTQEQPVDPEPEPMTDENPDDLPVPADENPELNAETIAQICEGIESKAGDLRISQIRAACENRPEFVDQIIEQHGSEFGAE